MNDQFEKSPASQAALDQGLTVTEARFNMKYPRSYAILGFEEFEVAVRFAKRFNGKIKEFQKGKSQSWYVMGKAKGPYVLFNASSKSLIGSDGDVDYSLVLGVEDESVKDDTEGRLSMRYRADGADYEIGVLVRIENTSKKSLKKKKKTQSHFILTKQG